MRQDVCCKLCGSNIHSHRRIVNVGVMGVDTDVSSGPHYYVTPFLCDSCTRILICRVDSDLKASLTRAHILSWGDVFSLLKPYDSLANVVYGVPKGGMIVSAFLKFAKVTHDPSCANLILDDVIDSGRTRVYYRNRFPGTEFVALVDKRELGESRWVIFPWEQEKDKLDGDK